MGTTLNPSFPTVQSLPLVLPFTPFTAPSNLHSVSPSCFPCAPFRPVIWSVSLRLCPVWRSARSLTFHFNQYIHILSLNVLFLFKSVCAVHMFTYRHTPNTGLPCPCPASLQHKVSAVLFLLSVVPAVFTCGALSPWGFCGLCLGRVCFPGFYCFFL